MADVLGCSPSRDALGDEDLSIVVLEVGMNLLGIGRQGLRRKGIDGDVDATELGNDPLSHGVSRLPIDDIHLDRQGATISAATRSSFSFVLPVTGTAAPARADPREWHEFPPRLARPPPR